MTLRRTALLVGLLLLVVASTAFVSDRVMSDDSDSGSGYTLVQMNLCLSGRASCFSDVRYPSGVEDAATKILDADADAVTLDEVCESDVEELADKTGFHAHFAAVTYHGSPVVCSDPDDRGGYGIAILTKAPITASVDQPYATQGGIEDRYWMCASTAGATVCATHLDIRGSDHLDSVNDGQCAEFVEVLQRFDRGRPLIAGGDMNRADDCAASHMWVETDSAAGQAAGKQHVYGTEDFSEPVSRIIATSFTDHDVLVVSSPLATPAPR